MDLNSWTSTRFYRVFHYLFQKEIAKYPSVKKHKKELSEDRIDDILENICNDEWTQYGIKEVDGINRLSGPGFETNDIPGVMQGGGKWPFRLVLQTIGRYAFTQNHKAYANDMVIQA